MVRITPEELRALADLHRRGVAPPVATEHALRLAAATIEDLRAIVAAAEAIRGLRKVLDRPVA